VDERENNKFAVPCFVDE